MTQYYTGRISQELREALIKAGMPCNELVTYGEVYDWLHDKGLDVRIFGGNPRYKEPTGHYQYNIVGTDGHIRSGCLSWYKTRQEAAEMAIRICILMLEEDAQ